MKNIFNRKIKKFRQDLSFFFPFLDNESVRRRWIKKELSKISKNESILDAGAGECQYKKYCKHLKYKSQDFGKYNGKGNGIGLQTKKWDNTQLDIVSDITNIPIKNNHFDNILCTEVLEHLPYPDLAIKELSRILKKNGKLIMTAPFSSLTHFAPYHFCTGFNIYWYKKIFVDNNLKIISFNRNGNFYDFLNQELLRFPLIAKKSINYFAYLLYIVILPIVLIVLIISKFDHTSDSQLCFGYHILAMKIK